jgi:glyoxylase-like metal-dependent hydrolase (beta-lactamase superfamily II)
MPVIREPGRVRFRCWLPALASLTWALTASAQQVLSAAPAPLYPGAPLLLWETEKITEDVYGFRYSVYRDIFIVTEEGVIVTDPINAKAAPILRNEIRKITPLPVKYVAYSHSHWDHIGGGQVFKDEGAQFVAQEQCAANLRENPGTDVITPDITFRDRYRISLGGKSLEMFYFGPSHDNCLVIMLARPANMLFVVDVANPPNGWHMPYNPTFSEDRVWNMVPFLSAVEDLIRRENIHTIIGGHVTTEVNPQTGRPELVRGTIGPAATVGERRMFLQVAIEAVRAELAAGTPAGQVPDKLVAGKLLADRVLGYEPEKMRMLLTRMTNYAQTGE